MADNFTPVQAKRFTLSGSGCSSSATSITVTNFELPSGTSITMSMFGTLGYAVLEPGTTRVEVISFTGVTDNGDGTSTLTGVTRGLNFVAPYTGDSSRAVAHVGGSGLVLSNPAVYYSKFASLDNDETIAGQYTFTQTPKTSDVPVSPEDIVNKTYVDALALGTTTTDRLIVAATAGETVAAGNLVYFDLTDNEWKKTDADTAATVEGVMLGIAQGSGTNGNAITGGVLIHGVDTNQTGMTQGDPMYASNTAGGIASSAGTTSRVIGIARSATNLYFDPFFYYVSTSAVPTSFVSTSAGAADSGKGVKLNASGLVDITMTGQYSDVVEFTSSGTWTKDANLEFIRVQAWGAGGSGGSGAAGGGGGGGSYVEATFLASQLASTETVTIGDGGTAVTNADGNAGGNTTFGSLLTAYGGGKGSSSAGSGAGAGGGGAGTYSAGSNAGADGGQGGDPVGSAGGSSAAGTGNTGFGGAGGGDQGFNGGSSAIGGGGGGGDQGTGGNSVYGGAGGGGGGGALGGTSRFGGNGGRGGDGSSPAAVAGSVPGGGGGGQTQAGFASGAGGKGKLIVYEFYTRS